MKKLYNKYVNYIVCGLLLFCLFKSCQSCSRSRQKEFNDLIYTELLDSLKGELNNSNKTIDSLNNEIKIYANEIQLLNEIIYQYKKDNQSLRDDNKHFRNTNSILINTNNQIINKE